MASPHLNVLRGGATFCTQALCTIPCFADASAEMYLGEGETDTTDGGGGGQVHFKSCCLYE